MLRDWIYFPRSSEYALPWILGPAVSMTLALLGLPSGKNTLPVINWTSTTAYTLAAVAVAVLNALVFLTHVRTQFLTWKTARRPFFGTYILLTAIYLLIFGLVLVQTGQAQMSIRRVDFSYTARCILIGTCSILPALLVSALWKSEEPGVTNLRLQRAVALRLMRALRSEQRIVSDDYRTLTEVLEKLPETARTVRSQLIAKADRSLSGRWADAAERALAAVQDKTVDDYYIPAIRAEREPIVAEALTDLESDK